MHSLRSNQNLKEEIIMMKWLFPFGPTLTRCYERIVPENKRGEKAQMALGVVNVIGTLVLYVTAAIMAIHMLHMLHA